MLTFDLLLVLNYRGFPSLHCNVNTMETGEGSAASTEQQESAQNPSAEQDLQNTLSLKRSPRKRKRRHSDETIPSKAHGNKLGYRPANKKSKLHSQLFAMSSTKAANNVMKFRLGGSVSDPLNLSGAVDLGDDCSTCAPSPVNADVFGQPSPLPPQLQHDPLNLEGKVKNFPANKHGLAIKHLLGGELSCVCLQFLSLSADCHIILSQ